MFVVGVIAQSRSSRGVCGRAFRGLCVFCPVPDDRGAIACVELVGKTCRQYRFPLVNLVAF